ncbi:TonB-dependent receptor [Pedobacter gandavensis]|uniref:TonB-dependent receptor n=1 Tax=Pedobacter gandavensis TaxID=2679963 RepID=UPI00292CEBF3|nr:TonB-dependent receptor [Pedobacter gandavensis]
MKYLWTLMVFCSPLIGLAQEKLFNKKITLSVDSAKIRQFVDAIERQSNCFFYFDEQKFDGLVITMDVKDQPLEKVLQEAFQNKGVYYSIEDNHAIYLSTDAIISFAVGEKPVITVTKKYLSPAVKANEKSPPDPTVNPLIHISYEENKIYDIGIKTKTFGTGNATVAGYVRYHKTGEGISGASIAVEGFKIRAISDQYGYFSITLPKGKHTLHLKYVGLSDTKRQLMLYGDGKMTIVLTDYITALNVVNIASEKTSNVRSTLMGMQKVNIKTVKQLPALLGEPDIIRVILNLPGVTSVGEGSTGLNVRGGAVDQNLVLYDGATIYNPSHFFGFFSGFNPDVVKDAELYKSSIPIKYGGRLSSVLEVVTREGNHNKFSGSGGIGPLNAHLTFEGPIGKKTTFIAGGRATYSNWLLGLLDDEKYQRSKGGFQDLNLRISHDANEKNSIYFSGYLSADRFSLDGDSLYKYANKNVVVKWKRIFNNRLFSVVTAGYDSYNFSMESENGNINDFKFKFDVRQYHGKADFTYVPNVKHKFEAGLSAISYKLRPGDYFAIGKGQVLTNTVEPEQGLDAAVYLSDTYIMTPDLSLNVGVRFNLFHYNGPQTIYEYLPGAPRSTVSISNTIQKTGTIKSYIGLEPRASLRYTLSSNASIKMAYNRTRQNIHMLSNTTAISPMDTWKLSDNYLRPQIGDQFALGYYRNFKDNSIETSIEAYYKRIQHAITYKNGAELLLNPHIETEIANASGKAYGIEFLIKKTTGKLTGWLSYTFSRTFLKMDDPLVPSAVNNGNFFPADYDKPHVVNFISNYKLSHRFSVSLTTNYSTGRPITYPIARYYYADAYRMLYADRNTYRIPDYFRTDFSMNIEGNHKVKKLFHSSFTVGIYNLTGRRNPYSVYFVSENGKTNGYKFSIFGAAIPFATYNFKF